MAGRPRADHGQDRPKPAAQAGNPPGHRRARSAAQFTASSIRRSITPRPCSIPPPRSGRAPRALSIWPARHADHRKRWRTRSAQTRRAEAAPASRWCPRGWRRSRPRCSSVVGAGDHILITDSVYRPTRIFCDTILKRLGVETTYYDPLIGGGIAKLFKPNTRAVFVEAPGSQSFEMQDIPGHRQGRARQRRSRADGQHLGDAALSSAPSTKASICRSRPAPNISAGIPTSCSARLGQRGRPAEAEETRLTLRACASDRTTCIWRCAACAR